MPNPSFPNQIPDICKLQHSGTEGQSVNIMGYCPVCGHNGAKNWLRAPDRFHGRTEPYHLMRCSQCTLVWQDDPPPPSEMSQHYGSDYDRAIASGGRDPAHWNWRRDELLRYTSGGAILDIGCSSGGFLASMNSPSWRLFGIDMSGTMAKQTEARCGAHVFVGDILDAPFPSGSFDAISCFHVFEHCYRPWEVLGRVAEWLKPGGIFYAMMPNIDSAGACIFGSYWYALELPRHLYHFSPVTLRHLAKSAGLQEVLITTHRELFVEASTRYVVDEIFRRVGLTRVPLARAKAPSIPWKVVRKLFRLTILPVLTGLASFAGEGETIVAVFKKNALDI